MVLKYNSFTEILRAIGLSETCRFTRTSLRVRLEDEGIDISHLMNHKYTFKEKIPNDKWFIKGVNRSAKTTKKRLLNDFGVKNQCSKCGICEWLDDPLSLHLDHVDGDRLNNTIDNLRLLCPNCHSQTPTYAGKKNKGNMRNTVLCSCGNVKSKNAKTCVKCYVPKKKIDISRDEMLKLLRCNKSVLAVARILNVSDNAVRKWCLNEKIEIKSELNLTFNK